MSKENVFEIKGTVLEVCRNGLCKIQVQSIKEPKNPEEIENIEELSKYMINRVIQAQISGKIRNFKIKILKGDSVIVQITPYDLDKGRITFREKVQKKNQS